MLNSILNKFAPIFPCLYGSYEFYLCEAYCQGKGRLFNMFLGWRESREEEGKSWCFYRIPIKDLEIILHLTENEKETFNERD